MEARIHNDPCIDCRVIDMEGFKATIKYIGPVKGAKNIDDIWLGVEWDSIGRGKHNGQSVDENGTIHKYFECSKPNSGSFIKLNKILYGRSFIDALNERYVSLDAPSIVESETSSLSDAYVNTLKGNQKNVLFVGEDKIRKRQQISNVTSIALRNDTIDHIDSEQVGIIASHLQEIDLQDNLLWQWIEVAKLGMQVPNLRVLLLHANKFQQITESICDSFPKNCFSNLKVLALNNCGIKSWASIQLLDPHLPCIEELYIANNLLIDLPCLVAEKEYQDATGITTNPILAGVSGFPTLKLLDITGCGLIEWSQVSFFGKLLNLQELILDNNPLPEILPPQADDVFLALKRFSLSNTSLSNWKDVDTLSMYPSLRILRLSQIPLFAGKGSSEARFEVIARIKQLIFFNGSPISTRERVESEKNYLRCLHYDPKFSGNQSSEQMLINQQIHPRYKELMELYGADLVPVSKATIGPSNLASELINITFKNLSFGSNGSLEPITKKLPRSLLISKLQMLMKQLFGLDPKLQHLSMRLYKDGPPTFLDDEKATLAYYGAIEGAEIFINEGKAS